MRSESLPDLDTLNRSIRNLYDAAVNADLWPSALEGIVSACVARGISLFPLSTLAQPSSTAFYPYYVTADLQEATEVYFRDWIWRSPINLHLANNPEYDTVVFDADVLDEGVLRNDPFYREYARYYQLMNCMMRVTKATSAHPGFMIISPFSIEIGIPSQQQLKLFDALSAHAAKAIEIHVQIGRAKGVTGELSELFADRDCGLVLIDGAGRVMEANAKAIEMSGDGFSIGKAGIRAVGFGQQAVVDELLRRPMQPSLWDRRTGPVAIRRSGGKKPLLANAIPVRCRSDMPLSGLLGAGDGVLLVLVDPETSIPGTNKDLFVLLGLSEAEARVAGVLGSGASPEKAAVELNLSTGTVRSHLKRIFSKLGISRQSELVALAGRLSALSVPR